MSAVVIQADRESAARFRPYVGETAAGLRDESPLVQAFAAHREAHTAGLVAILRALVTAACDFHEAAGGHLSDTTYDSDGVLAKAEAELSVSALPSARAALAEHGK